MNKPWYQSKTCWGSLFGGLGMIFSGIGGHLSGEIAAATACTAVFAGIGIVLIAVGLRDAIEKK